MVSCYPGNLLVFGVIGRSELSCHLFLSLMFSVVVKVREEVDEVDERVGSCG